ncbi:MAG: M23 family metallopeptidase [Erythrobacter sp.]|uniref:M23 family metallopeptidase n=1 Tax=Erythrobacter sp. TaxID=1042 RepID=UPI00261A34FE|nr:M23 family metallopeptidase [Erythrobacter sp.]MDJ0978332.1 M23 family metallopeptidase [Erythrobacter sp.]
MRIAQGHKGSIFLKLGGAALMLSAASPALANTSASTAADVTTPVEEAQAEELATGDPSFRQLFARWTALDTAGPDPFAVETPSVPQPVSVPSRSPLTTGRLTSGYGMRVHPVLRRRKKHSGIDLAAPTGTPVYATADGEVARADRSSSYGLVIYLDHGAELQTRYAHLSKLLVADGQEVKKGDVIGYVGSTGRSTGPHLHYEVRVDGVAVNPIPYMKEVTTVAEKGTTGSARYTGQGGE